MIVSAMSMQGNFVIFNEALTIRTAKLLAVYMQLAIFAVGHYQKLTTKWPSLVY
jgi:hypothetical protein